MWPPAKWATTSGCPYDLFAAPPRWERWSMCLLLSNLAARNLIGKAEK
jgi:hypothetical protein